VWPEPGAPLVHPVLEVPPGFATPTVFVVGGHGAPGNRGNVGAWCTREEDFTLDAADDLADLLQATGRFDVVRGRSGAERPTYPERLARLATSPATALIELHSDARGAASAHRTTPDGETCWRNDLDAGFTVLVSDEGPAGLVSSRLALARAIAIAMANAGFPVWPGDYEAEYAADEVAGVWRDRRGLAMLRRPGVPSVIIETHNARDGRESLRWEEDRTRHAFGRAVIAALLAYYAPPAAPPAGPLLSRW
jgi:N-acetylmuramoyl-L-alanine amidase